MFQSPRNVSRSLAEILLPTRRIKPREAVRRYLRTEKGAFDMAIAAMQLDALDLLTSRQYNGIVYVGPSRGSKTFTLVIGGLTYVVTCAPGDTQITQMSQDMAREMSKKDIDRAIEASPELKARLSPRPRDDNVYDKHFRSGMQLTIAWPSASQHSSKTLKYAFLTDYDNVVGVDNIDGRGSLWDLAYARIRTMMSRGKCVAESSPGSTYKDPHWQATEGSPHEAPPATGILAIYNLGTRARSFWPCLTCGEFFQAKPGLDCFALLPEYDEIEKEVQRREVSWLAEQWAKIPCPACGFMHEPQHKPEMVLRSRWVHEGESLRANGKTGGERRRTDIASFWQGGVSATYQRWDTMLQSYLQAVLKYVRTGDESSLQTRTNTDLAAPYLPRAIAKRRNASHLLARREDWARGTLPAGVRFVTAAVDVQSHRFAVTIYGWGELLERWVVDRFSITASARKEGERSAAIDPGSYDDDWDLLVGNVIERKFAVPGSTGTLTPLLSLVDSGGKAGVTTKAYAFWRRLRDRSLGKRMMLVKGVGQLNAPRVKVAWPDSQDRKDRHAGATGDVPLWLLNVNVIKDGCAGDLAREAPGPGYVHFPDWLDPDFFDELTAEARDERGWSNPRGARNEEADLHAYNRAACIILKAEQIDWRRPPEWAAPFEQRTAINPIDSAPKQRRMRTRGMR